MIINSDLNKKVFVYCITTLAVIVFWFDLGGFHEQIDDSYISFQYAKNLTSGNGLVFNVGERVEGYTNLLWTLLLALGIKLGFSLEKYCFLLSVISSVAVLYCSAFLTTLLIPKRYTVYAGLAPWVIFSSNGFIHWTLCGLETPLYCLLIVASLILYINKNLTGLIIAVILVSLCRPDGVLLAISIAAMFFLKEFKENGGEIARYRELAIYSLCYLFFVLVYETWRYSYYGAWLPNTFYAKVGGIPFIQGWQYFVDFLKDGYGLLILPAIYFFLSGHRAAAIWIFLVIYVLYTIGVGGDVFGFERFYIPVLPVLISCGLAGTVRLLDKNKFFYVLSLCFFPITVVINLYFNNPGYKDEAASFPYSVKHASAHNTTAFGGAEVRIALLKKMLAAKPDTKVIAAISIGQVAYFSNKIRVIDMVGLVDAHIARSKKKISGPVLLVPGHQKTDSDYVLDQKPEFIMMRNLNDAPIMLPAMYDLSLNPRFNREYIWDEFLEVYRRVDS